MSGSGVLARLTNERGDEGAKQGFAAPARVVHELEEAEVERQFVLRDAPVRSQPGAQQRPVASSCNASASCGVNCWVAVAGSLYTSYLRPGSRSCRLKCWPNEDRAKSRSRPLGQVS